MKNSISFIDYINDSIRLLIILEAANHLKPTHRVTENRIKLYDYFLRFPHTMTDNNLIRDETKDDFDEYYAFFHCKPDAVRYRSSLNFLMAKKLIVKRLQDSDIFFEICPEGIEALSKINDDYKQRLTNIAIKSFSEVYNLSDKKIEEMIAKKTNILSNRIGGINDEN